eukprot:m.362446 g.362446  ORF g.362446 m.362446 type:complete len:67 (-) comp20493_c0_seq1:69-269(-)
MCVQIPTLQPDHNTALSKVWVGVVVVLAAQGGNLTTLHSTTTTKHTDTRSWREECACVAVVSGFSA